MSDKKVLIEDKVALVTGSNRGIGKAITEALLEKGASKVYAGARDVSSLNELQEKYGERLVPVELDVTNDSMIKAAAETAGDVDILINNAGVFRPGNFSGGGLVEGLQGNLEVNLYGPTKLITAMLDNIKGKDSAAIATVASMVSFGNMPMGLAYSVSKAAVHSLMQGLRAELGGTNVLVSGIYPGPIDTDMTKGFDMQMDSPETVAQNVVKGLEEGTEYIFPDAMAQQAGEVYMKSPVEVEKMFASFGQ